MRLSLLLLLILCAPLPWAQESTPAEPAESAEGEENAEQNERATSEAERQEAAPRSNANNDSPFEYEASEQISEDLSVSFPVDI